jgi:AraC-like DNA-binding protein
MRPIRVDFSLNFRYDAIIIYFPGEISMSYSENKMAELVHLLERHTPEEGVNETGIPEFATLRETSRRGRCATVYQSGVALLGQGKKVCYIDGKRYDYSAGRYLALYMPLPMESEVIEASPEKPLLMAGLKIDVAKIAKLVLKMNQLAYTPPVADPADAAVIFAEPVNDTLIDPIIRLLRTLDKPFEREMLAESIIEEIYFRLIINDPTGALQQLLENRGHMQQISTAVNHIHQNLNQVVSIDELALLVNMSTSSFRKSFRQVMHMPPLQYAKAIKLDRAQRYIQQGKNASEAGYLVGYNSPAQFSREYKRHFGFAPSATIAAA